MGFAMVGDPHDETPEREQSLADDLQQAYARAILVGDAATAESTVREAIEAGIEEATIDDRIIRPALVLVGDLWEQGLISIADEQAATSISVRVLALQREAFRAARRRARQRILLAGAPGEKHLVGLEMAASVILHAGYDVRMLGADLQLTEILPMLAVHRPAIIGLSSASSISAAHLPAAFEVVRAASPETAIIAGGRGVHERLAASAPDVVVCRHVSDAVGLVDALVNRASRN